MPATFASPPSRQLFSVPYNFVLYITENPVSPEGYEKLQQTCKYFFAKNQILVTDWHQCGRDGYGLVEKKIAKTCAKFWPSYRLNIRAEIDLQKFYRFSPKLLCIGNIASLSFKEFNLIVAENSVIKFELCHSSIKDATIDVVFKKLKNVSEFIYNNRKEMQSVETLRKLYLIQNDRKLEHFKCVISSVSQAFSPSSCFYLAQKPKYPDTGFRFHSNFEEEFFAKNIQRKYPDIFKVKILPDCVSLKSL